MSSENTIPILVEFTGGLEMLFGDERKHKLSIPSKDEQGNAVNIGWLVKYLCDKVMKDSRKEMFVLDGHVRPGILVLINDADWELEGEASYALLPNDNILFVSTLHGG
ncbi:MoaD/ThiS [Glarea lozoyensis ATCC 20868]|uniref:Ubiquitin-related modifier 1 n=1 Tax=Glarea lozoyensis (strain ATCC 20868 / MF5171) TaxID=1116229 RepID=S3DBU7_GLAL2|nr:MoaD/ThiS [Glarea lozoyensis ATCC 20868]EPE34579.1 MoaD/ThiS [Glarea lozoyensis ATCC 20868]